MGDWTQIVAVIIGFVLALLSSLIAYIFHDLRREVRTLARHVDSVVAVQWEVLWRTGGLEEFLRDQGYHPPTIILRQDK